jgi:hypothetical protein
MEPPNWLIKIVIYGLAVFRLSRLISLEEGPAGIFKHLRRWFGVKTVKTLDTTRLDHEVNPITNEWESKYVELEVEVAKTTQARFISCPLCTSVWLALPAAVFLWLGWLFGDVVASWLALASITVLFHRDD